MLLDSAAVDIAKYFLGNGAAKGMSRVTLESFKVRDRFDRPGTPCLGGRWRDSSGVVSRGVEAFNGPEDAAPGLQRS